MRVQEAADRLREAGAHARPCIPVRDLISTVEDAYAVQQINIDARVQDGRCVIGKKIGLTASAVQEQLGVDQPDYGSLLEDMCLTDGASVELAGLLQPRVEVEVMLVMGQDLNKERHTVSDLLDCSAFVTAAIEIVDSRIRDWDITIVDTIADNASSALFVTGTEQVEVADTDLPNAKMELTVNGQLSSIGIGANCLGHPMNAAVWLADKMAEMGTPIAAGDYILTGALGPMVPITEPCRVSAAIDGLGSVTVDFVEGT